MNWAIKIFVLLSSLAAPDNPNDDEDDEENEKQDGEDDSRNRIFAEPGGIDIQLDRSLIAIQIVG